MFMQCRSWVGERTLSVDAYKDPENSQLHKTTQNMSDYMKNIGRRTWHSLHEFSYNQAFT